MAPTLEAVRPKVVVPEIIIKDAWLPEPLKAFRSEQTRLDALIQAFQPKTHLGRTMRKYLGLLPREAVCELLDAISSVLVVESRLYVARIIGPLSAEMGLGKFREYQYFGLSSYKVITTTGVDKLADAFINTFEPETFNYHGIGTGSTAEAAADTALVTELTTQYNPDNTRATGTQSNPSANVFRSVGTNAVDATVTIAEHGLLSSATVAAGSLWDRSLVSPTVGLNSGDSLQTTYDGTLSSGG